MFDTKRALRRASLLASLLIASSPVSSFAQASYKLFDSGQIRIVDKKMDLAAVTPQAKFVVDKSALTELRRSSVIEVREVPLFVDGSDDVKLVDLELTEFSALAPNAVITVTTHDGVVAGPVPSVKLYRGTVKGVAGSTAYLALGTNSISGRISTPEADFSVGYEVANNNLSAVIADVRSIPSRVAFAKCENSDDDSYAPYGTKPATFASPKRSNFASPASGSPAAVAAEMAIDCDFEMYQQFGNDEQKVTDWVMARMGAITTVYENELGCALLVSNLNIFKVEDPYPTVSNIDPLLQAFTEYWKKNKTGVKRTLAHLFSREAFDNPNYSSGLAWVDGLCRQDIGYAVTRVWGSEQFPTVDDAVIAHEIGHNFGSQHTHNCQQWGTAIDSCVAAEGTCFTTPNPKTRGTIMSYCNDKVFSFGKRVQDFLLSQVEAASQGCLVPNGGGTAGGITVLSSNLTLGGVKLNESKDTTIVGYFKNTGTLPLSVLSATLTGSSDFEIVSPTFPLSLGAKKSSDLKIRYTATSENVENAVITFAMEGSTPMTTLNLTGSTAPSSGGDGKPLGFSAGAHTILWSNRLVGSTNDTTIIVQNRTTAAISTLQPKWDPTNAQGFAIVGNKLLSIPAGGTAELKLRFNPQAKKQFAVKLIIPFGTGQDTLMLSGAGINQGDAGVGSPIELNAEMTTQPNPFASTVQFGLHVGQLVGKNLTLQVFDVLGTKVTTLFDGVISSDRMSLDWKPEGLDAGTYYVVARVDDAVLTRKIIYKH